MRSYVQPMAENYQKEHKSKRRWQKVVSGLAAVVVFCTTYALILPAITWERSLVCELPEHKHTEKCYEEVVVVPETCELTCEAEEHEHTESCYEETKTLICEDETHEHTDECYVTENVLVCELAEHKHSDECYTVTEQVTEKQLVCGLEEHEHTDACFDAPPKYDDGYYCGLVEHTHNELCYTQDGSLRCTLEEHEHTLQCQSNPGADVETAEYWERTFEDVDLSGCWEKDVLAIAESQLGYCESHNNYSVEDGVAKGYTRYGDWYGVPYGDWCAMFCSFCINYAHVGDFPIDCACHNWTIKLDEIGLYHKASEYTPKPGDLVFFDWNGFTEETEDARTADHVGFVYEIIDATEESPAILRTLEGNWGDCVCFAERELDSTYILGYGEMPVNPEQFYDDISIEIDTTGRFITLTATVDGIEANAYKWQWQYYDVDVADWRDIDGATNFSMTVEYNEENYSRYYRICGTSVLGNPEQVSVKPGLFAGAIGNLGGGAVADLHGKDSTEDIAPVAAQVIYSAAVSPMAAGNGTETKTYWKPITSTTELTADGVYMIVENTNGVALNGSNRTTNVTANMTAVSGKPGYYTSELGEDYWWTVGANGASSKVQNVGTGNYLRISSSSSTTMLSNATNATTNTFSYSSNSDAWQIKGNNRYLRYSGGSFSASSSASYLTIYKQEIVTIEEEDPGSGGGGVTKPEYPAYLPVTGPLEGDTALDGISGEYWSDPATSQLESWFDGVEKDDGKVLTDKSVIYGKDDYGAFDSYDPNTFGVTLSALGQAYKLAAEVEGPIDVVFVVDVSGSMIDAECTDAQNKKSNAATETVRALNQAMKMVMDANPDNRMGVVCFSNYSKRILDLGRYEANNDKYFPDSYSDYDSNKDVFQPSNSIRRTDGGTLNKGSYTAGWYGTYTQSGIAEGAKELLEATDKQVDVTINIDKGDGRTIQKTVTMTRQPVIILLSDGEPTFCNENYSAVLEHNDTIHGSGSGGYTQDGDGQYRPVKNWGTYTGGNRGNGSYTDKSSYDGAYPPDYNASYYRVNNPKGVMGYYTILTANSYKEQVAKAYGTDTFFYTIGLGINEGSKDSIARSISSDIYKSAVLNPTAANIAALKTTSGRTICSQTNTADRDISPYTEETSTMLQQLLNDTATSGTNTWIKRSGGKDYVYVEILTDQWAREFGSPNGTTGQVPVIKNPYKGNYQYTDGATFTNNPSADELAAIYRQAIGSASKTSVYGMIFDEDPAANVTVSDTIGDGMEIKSEPVLNYGGVNYQPVSHETVGGKTVYHYEGTYTATDGSGQTADLSKITAEVETVNGKQVVRMVVPEQDMPLYIPYVGNDNNVDFYYESLPARLIYQVGLTEEAQNDVRALEGTGNSLTYYTNEWKNDHAYSQFSPMSANPYYKNNDYDKDPLVKSDNNTETAPNAWEYDPDCSARKVNEHLGNNGKLTFTSEYYETVDVELHKTDPDGNLITTDTAKFEVYKDAQLTSLKGTFETDENGVLTITGLRTGQTYYLKEVKAPGGYEPLSGVKAFSVDDNGALVGIGTDEFFRVDGSVITVVNDFGHTSKTAEKRWEGKLAAGESYPSEVQFQLYKDGEAYGQPKTASKASSWKAVWDNLPMIAPGDHHEIVYTVEEIAIDGYATSSQEIDGTTVITNHKINDTSLSVLKKWEGGSETSVRVELLKNGEPTGQFVTLSAENDWYHMWENLPDYDENGPITYSVREIAVEGYEGDIHLWTGSGDPYGQTGSEGWVETSNFVDGETYVLAHKYNGSDVAIGVNTSENSPYRYDINLGDPDSVGDNCKWKASVSGSNITLTNVGTGQKLVLNSSDKLALGGSNNHATTWKYDSNHRLYAEYTTRVGFLSRTYTYYYNAESGTTDNSRDATPITLYKYDSTVVEDPCEKGDEHYIIKNIKQDVTPSSLSLEFIKADGESGKKLTGATFELYRETGVETDPLIPGTTDRHGMLYAEWTTNGSSKTISIGQNGTYYLVETAPPDGYLPLEEPIVFEVTSQGTTRKATVSRHPTMENGDGFTSMTVPNIKDERYCLPETGSVGTTLYYALSVLFITGALMCGSFSRRKRERRTE